MKGLDEIKKSNSWLQNCPACAALNNTLAQFCEKCNYRFEANLSPLGVIQSEAEMLGKSLSQKPKFIVLFGTWIIFLPVFVTSMALIVSQVLHESGTAGFLFFWLGIIIGVFSLKFLYTITKNYFTMKEKSFENI